MTRELPAKYQTFSFYFQCIPCSTHNVKLCKKVPDIMSSWIITGFSVDPIAGLSLTKQPSTLTVFQPFLVTTNLPYSIKRGEVISIPVLVFNYMDVNQTAEVTLFNGEEEFEFVELYDGNQTDRMRNLETQKTKKVTVMSQIGVTVRFMIRALKVGLITIKVVGRTSLAGDSLEKQLLVEPEGVTQFRNQVLFVDLQSSNELKTTIEIDVPSHAVPDSTKIEFSVIGDILGTSIENLDKLM